jgi:hypothetical protein
MHLSSNVDAGIAHLRQNAARSFSQAAKFRKLSASPNTGRRSIVRESVSWLGHVPALKAPSWRKI